MNVNIWAAARAFASALRAGHDGPRTSQHRASGTGTCPDWCTSDHRCTAWRRFPNGEHRSRSVSTRTPYGMMTTTRTASVGGVTHVEMLLSVRLDMRDRIAIRQAQLLTSGVDLATRAVLATSAELREVGR